MQRGFSWWPHDPRTRVALVGVASLLLCCAGPKQTVAPSKRPLPRVLLTESSGPGAVYVSPNAAWFVLYDDDEVIFRRGVAGEEEYFTTRLSPEESAALLRELESPALAALTGSWDLRPSANNVVTWSLETSMGDGRSRSISIRGLDNPDDEAMRRRNISPDQLGAFEQVVKRLSTFWHPGVELWLPSAAVLSTSAVRPEVMGSAELCAWPEAIHLGPNQSPSPVKTDRSWTLTGAQFVAIQDFLAVCHHENDARLVLLDGTAVDARLRVALPHEEPVR